MSDKLLPCPFCGKWAHTGHHRSRHKDDEYYLVMCAYCFARTVGETVDEAIAAWNRRSDAVPVVRGEWEEMRNPYGELEGFMCACGRTSQSADNYCPNCGADMRGRT